MFIDFNHLVFKLPLFVVIAGYALILAVSVYVYRSFHKEPSDRQRKLIYLGWFAILPGILNLILLLIYEFDLLYDYSGVMFGGLGQFLYRLFAMAVCVLYLIVFAIVNFIVKKRRQKGKRIDPEKVARIKDELNLLIFAAALILLVLGMIVFILENTEEWVYNTKMAKVNAFKEEMYEKIGGADAGSIIYDEAKGAVLFTEISINNGLDLTEIDQENGNVFRYTTVDHKVLEKAAGQYRDLADGYSDPPVFSEGKTDEFIDPFEKKYSVGFSEVYGEKRYTFVLVYDEDWKLTDSYIKEGYLTTVSSYKDL